MENKGNQDNINQGDFKFWAKDKVNPNALNIWNQSVTQVWNTSNDVWNAVRFFLTVNAVIIAAIISFLAKQDYNLKTATIIVVLTVVGLILTFIGFGILEKMRGYHLEAVVRKTLLEKKLGFYDFPLHVDNKVTLASEWQVPKKHFDKLEESPKRWMKDHMFEKGTVMNRLRFTYYLVGAIYIALLGILIYSILWADAEASSNHTKQLFYYFYY